jgi:hypothetical protein
MENESKLTCPFCGGEVHIVVSDDEGNIHEEEGYEEDPWSGLGYQIRHTREDIPEGKQCPIATWPYEEQGTYIYDTREEIVELWNRRV